MTESDGRDGLRARTRLRTDVRGYWSGLGEAGAVTPCSSGGHETPRLTDRGRLVRTSPALGQG